MTLYVGVHKKSCCAFGVHGPHHGMYLLFLRHVSGLLQDKIEELQASLHAVGAEAKELSEQNTASEQELQVRLSCVSA